MVADLFTYCWLLISHWAAFMTGGIIAAAFFFLERLREKQFGWRPYFIVFVVFGFFAASYQTWRDEYVARVQAEQSKPQPEPRKTQLQLFYKEGQELVKRPLSKNISPEDFKKYEDEANAWLNKTINWIQQNMGETAKSRFLDTSRMFSFSYPGAINEEHSKVINGLNNFCKNLQTLIVEFNAWDEKKIE